MSENTQIWDAVARTDPDMTKQVTHRGGFTAITSYYTFRRATELFGPVGLGWGYTARREVDHQAGLVFMDIELWYVWQGKRSEPVPIFASHKLMDGKGVDDDAVKKALTDGLTKVFSILGFSADVFTGLFDDAKYVQSLRDEKKAAAAKPYFGTPQEMDVFRDGLMAAFANAMTLAEIDDKIKANAETLRAIEATGHPDDRSLVATIRNAAKAKLGELKASA